MASTASASRPPAPAPLAPPAPPSTTTTRLKRTSGWFSSAKANLKAIATSSGGGGGVVDSATPPPGLRRNGSLRASFSGSRPNLGGGSSSGSALTIKTATTTTTTPAPPERAGPSSSSRTTIREEEEPGRGEVPAARKRIIGAVQDEWPLYSCRAQDYTILEPIGFGSSSVVHLANYAPAASSSSTPPLRCAVKIIDVDRLSSVGDIDRLRRETQLMALSKHPNVLRVRGEWIQDCRLFIAVRYMTHGSLLDISRYAFPDGFDENVIATVLDQALHGLVYLHQNGWLHRDIKAANLLVDDDGTVLLADFGVSSSLFQEAAAATRPPTAKAKKNSARATSSSDEAERDDDDGEREEEEEDDDSSSPFAARKSFVGTPSWMAPEVIKRKSYDSKADVWSFGITALELASGRAPNSLYPPAKALSKTILDDPPALDRDGGKYKYSKAFKDMVDTCLQKDPKKRPTAEKLLQHAFFKSAKKKSYLVSAILDDLPPLQERQQRRRRTSHDRADTMASGWDFNPTQPSTPLSARRPSQSDPFASFSTTNSPYNTLPSRSLSNVASSPTRAALPSMFHPAVPSSTSSSSMQHPQSTASSRRSRDASSSSTSRMNPASLPQPHHHHHHRGVSFDFDVAASPTSSPIVDAAPRPKEVQRTRDASVASGGRGSVHFADPRGQEDDDDDDGDGPAT
ncbi:hypothetical protein JCM11491_003534 [Sporobolomyces phaffii]